MTRLVETAADVLNDAGQIHFIRGMEL